MVFKINKVLWICDFFCFFKNKVYLVKMCLNENFICIFMFLKIDLWGLEMYFWLFVCLFLIEFFVVCN